MDAASRPVAAMTSARLPWLASRIPAHVATTAHLAGAYPFLADPGLGVGGVYIGRDVFGGSFCYDPFELYARRVLSNPNMLITGQVGAGKSSLVKSFVFRQLGAGRAAWIADPRGEYAALAAAAQATVIRLGPGEPARLNPFDLADSNDTGEAVQLLAALAGTALGRPLSPVEATACQLACEHPDTADGLQLPVLVDALLDPSPAAARAVRMSETEFRAATRDLALVLRRLCAGDLTGMFDGPSTVTLDPAAPLVVVDLSAVYQGNRDALPLLLACTTAWLHAMIRRRPGVRRFVVVDEAWALLSHLGTAQWLQRSCKLARAYGLANILLMHRFSDLTATGPAGSQTASLAAGLLSDTGTQVLLTHPGAELAAARDLLGLNQTELALLPDLRVGESLWRVGSRSFLVQHRLSDIERWIVDTDAPMTGQQVALPAGLTAAHSPRTADG